MGLPVGMSELSGLFQSADGFHVIESGQPQTWNEFKVVAWVQCPPHVRVRVYVQESVDEKTWADCFALPEVAGGETGAGRLFSAGVSRVAAIVEQGHGNTPKLAGGSFVTTPWAPFLRLVAVVEGADARPCFARVTMYEQR